MATKPFLSTPSGWRATASDAFFANTIAISIHALRVEGDPFRSFLFENFGISIHALRVEGDADNIAGLERCVISIHALRVEGDSKNGQSFRLFLRKREKNLPL